MAVNNLGAPQTLSLGLDPGWASSAIYNCQTQNFKMLEAQDRVSP